MDDQKKLNLKKKFKSYDIHFRVRTKKIHKTNDAIVVASMDEICTESILEVDIIKNMYPDQIKLLKQN